MAGVGFIGLGTMGGGMAGTLVKKGFKVTGFDVSEPAMVRLKESGGRITSSPAESAEGASVLVVMVANSEQVEATFYGPQGAASALQEGATVILCSTVPPDTVKRLQARLTGEGKGFLLVDAPVSGSPVEAAEGTLTIMAAGSEEALQKADAVLRVMSEHLFIVPGGVGLASSLKMVNQLLAGVHIAAAAEAMALGARAGLNPRMLFDIIKTAAGSSWMFVDRVPRMLSAQFSPPRGAMDGFVKDMSIVLGEAKTLKFPCFLAAAAAQYYTMGAAAGYGKEDDSAIIKLFEQLTGVTLAVPEDSVPPKVTLPAGVPCPVGFIGLGAMGSGMAAVLVKEGFKVRGFDVWGPSMAKLQAAGGATSASPADAAKGAAVLVVMVTNADQAEAALYGPDGAVAGLPEGATVVLCSTVPPDFVRNLEKRLQGENKGLLLVDAPVSGGVARAADGSLTIMAAGREEALQKAAGVLQAMSGNLYIIPGGAGQGSAVKMVNQHLAGVHIATSAEAVALGARAGIDTRLLFEAVSKSAGTSWMFENRVPHMLDNDYTPKSALDIFVKDLGIVLGEAKGLKFPLPLAAAAHQLFLMGSAAGFGREDDAAVVKVYEKLLGVSVACPPKAPPPEEQKSEEKVKTQKPVHTLSLESMLAELPSEWAEDVLPEIQEAVGKAKTLVVLDDDPTGTQTVHGVTVLTEWSVASLRAELEKKPACFFLLTNSRALHTKEAVELTKEICTNLASAAGGVTDFTVVLRGDSTLRGHFPQEPEAVTAVVGESDAWLLAPFFPQGGRYTINDVHYVGDGDRLVPAGQTEFAKDAAFGYKSSNLKEWVQEKTGGRISVDRVMSVSLQTIRTGGPAAVCQELCNLPKGSVCIANAVSETDMRVFTAGMLRAEQSGRKFLCRTAATFVSCSIGLTSQPPLGPSDLGVTRRGAGKHGGLVVVGSYVPKTTSQVEELIAQCGAYLEKLEVSVSAIASGSSEEREREIVRAIHTAEKALRAGGDVLLFTSRQLVTGKDAESSLAIGQKVSSALVEIVKRISLQPRYLLAKGGITSSDLATKALGARRAEVAGQALPGVPLWRLGQGSRYPGMPYIVFPGNVGGKDALAAIVKKWAHPPGPTTAAILKGAQAGGYAIGAFNVYNMEGALAVVRAAEEQRSPAMLQIHPSALEHGGEPLVAACLAAAKQALVPVTVHLDHGADEAAVMAALDMGFDSVMVDGSQLPYEENVGFTQRVAAAAHARGIAVEAELGRLSGTEDGLTVHEYEAKLTDVEQAKEFLEATKVDALAVCIGNVHGQYPRSGPNIDLPRLKALHEALGPALLVLHGASGLPEETVKECIKLGVCKFNVNTEVRGAYVKALQAGQKDLLDVMTSVERAMKDVVVEKFRMFGSVGKATT